MIQVHNTNIFYNKLFFISIFLSIIIILNILFFFDIYFSKELSFYFIDKIHTLPSNVANILRLLHTMSISITWCFILNNIFNSYMKVLINKNLQQAEKHNFLSSSNLIIGKNYENNSIISIPEKGLYQNMLITRHNWYWKNIFSNVSFHKTINSNGLWYAYTRC